MNAQQELAFSAGAGAAPSELLFGISATSVATTLLWAASVVFTSYLMWRDRQLELVELIAHALRVSVILLIFGFYFN